MTWKYKQWFPISIGCLILWLVIRTFLGYNKLSSLNQRHHETPNQAPVSIRHVDYDASMDDIGQFMEVSQEDYTLPLNKGENGERNKSDPSGNIVQSNDKNELPTDKIGNIVQSNDKNELPTDKIGNIVQSNDRHELPTDKIANGGTPKSEQTVQTVNKQDVPLDKTADVGDHTSEQTVQTVIKKDTPPEKKQNIEVPKPSAKTQHDNVNNLTQSKDIQNPSLLPGPDKIGNDKHEKHDKGIPKIIHQIWKTDMIPVVFQENIKGLVTHNKPPDWTYYFWTDESGAALIKDIFPKLLYRYEKAAGVLKGDILRLVVLYQYGGAYFDLDTVSVKPLDPYMANHSCTLVTDPPEHTFSYDKPEPVLLITNSAMLCKPFNWFILKLIRELENQSPACAGALSCTGPWFITKFYKDFQGTNRSADLPIVDDYWYFEDMVDHKVQGGLLNRLCKEPFDKLKHEWGRDICRNWIQRGRDKRNISELAYTYHTWFHTYHGGQQEELYAGEEKRIAQLVPDVNIYPINKQ